MVVMKKKSALPLPVLQALAAAFLFACSTPLSKILLGDIDPIPLAAFLYLGSGVGAFLLRWVMKARRPQQRSEAKLSRSDLPWLIGAIFFGGVLAPIALLFGLRTTPAATASLLLNFEGVATALIAAAIFKEAIGKRVALSIGLITLASIVLSLEGGQWGLSAGMALILMATFSWGLDNNFTRNISERDPFEIVMAKGLGAGTFSLILTFALGKPLPDVSRMLMAGALGAVSYGLSIALIILAMRKLGSTRAYGWFGSAPFMAMLLSLAIFREPPTVTLWIALPFMLAGAWLMATEHHSHHHIHPPIEHEHTHTHPDPHHTHVHEGLDPTERITHSHPHKHAYLEHEHEHTPDIHHRHEH